jgi:hypothetical protein
MRKTRLKLRKYINKYERQIKTGKFTTYCDKIPYDEKAIRRTTILLNHLKEIENLRIFNYLVDCNICGDYSLYGKITPCRFIFIDDNNKKEIFSINVYNDPKYSIEIVDSLHKGDLNWKEVKEIITAFSSEKYSS